MMFVFVYGTLKNGFANHSVMERSAGVLVGKATTIESSYLLTSLGTFPAMLDKGTYSIKGELYSLSSLNLLDRLEGYPNFYTRKLIAVITNNKIYECWAYFLNDDFGAIRDSEHIVETRGPSSDEQEWV